MKIIQPIRASAISPEKKERFQREVTLLARLNHENIIKVIPFAKMYIIHCSLLAI